jgi:hypothetical protein
VNIIQILSIAQIIAFYGTDSGTRERTFLMYRDDDGEVKRSTNRQYIYPLGIAPALFV